MNLHEKAGLVSAGENEGGKMYLGTDTQWRKYEELQSKVDDLVEDEVNDLLVKDK